MSDGEADIPELGAIDENKPAEDGGSEQKPDEQKARRRRRRDPSKEGEGRRRERSGEGEEGGSRRRRDKSVDPDGEAGGADHRRRRERSRDPEGGREDGEPRRRRRAPAGDRDEGDGERANVEEGDAAPRRRRRRPRTEDGGEGVGEGSHEPRPPTTADPATSERAERLKQRRERAAAAAASLNSELNTEEKAETDEQPDANKPMSRLERARLRRMQLEQQDLVGGGTDDEKRQILTEMSTRFAESSAEGLAGVQGPEGVDYDDEDEDDDAGEEDALLGEDDIELLGPRMTAYSFPEQGNSELIRKAESRTLLMERSLKQPPLLEYMLFPQGPRFAADAWRGFKKSLSSCKIEGCGEGCRNFLKSLKCTDLSCADCKKFFTSCTCPKIRTKDIKEYLKKNCTCCAECKKGCADIFKSMQLTNCVMDIVYFMGCAKRPVKKEGEEEVEEQVNRNDEEEFEIRKKEEEELREQWRREQEEIDARRKTIEADREKRLEELARITKEQEEEEKQLFGEKIANEGEEAALAEEETADKKVPVYQIEQRKLKKEGLFVEPKPYVAPWHVARLSQWLLNDEIMSRMITFSRPLKQALLNFERTQQKPQATGVVNYDGLRYGLWRIGVALVEDEFETVCRLLDRDGTGEIVYRDFPFSLAEVDMKPRYFGLDGDLARLPEPKRGTFARPRRYFNPSAPYLQVEIQAPEMPAADIAGGGIASKKHYDLEIDVASLTFHDHPLFTEEDRLASSLIRLYQEYQRRGAKQMVQFYRDRLESLSQELDQFDTPQPDKANGKRRLSFQRPSLSPSPGSKSVKFTDTIASKEGINQVMDDEEKRGEMLDKLRSEIREARTSLYLEESGMYVLVRDMVRKWNKLKKVRERQQFIGTRVKLAVKMIPRDELTDLEHQRDYIDAQIEERRRVMHDRHERAVIDYTLNRRRKEEELESLRKDLDEKIEIYNEQQERKAQLMSQAREAKAEEREARRRMLAEKGEDFVESDGENENAVGPPAEEVFENELKRLEALEEGLDSMVEPEETEFNEGDERDAILEKWSKTFRNPGDPEVVPYLFNEGAIDETDLPRREKDRRASISQTLIYGKLYVNGRYVGKTGWKHIEFPSFKVNLEHIFQLRVARWPETVSLQIVEDGLVFDNVLSNCYLAVPGGDGEAPVSTGEPKCFQFACSKAFKPFTRSLKSSKNTYLLHGDMFALVQWTSKDPSTGEPIAPPPPAERRARFANQFTPGVVSAQKLNEITHDRYMDPNDPRNADLLMLMKNRDFVDSSRSGFKLSRDDEEIQLQGNLDERRMALIEKRTKGEVDARMAVPIEGKYIDNEVLEGNIQDNAGNDAKSSFLQEVRAKSIMQLVKGKKAVNIGEVVREPEFPEFSIKPVIRLVKFIFQEYHPLRPPRRESKPTTVHADHCDVLVQVVRGFNMPIRAKLDSNEEDGNETSDDKPKKFTETLAPFVEVTFQGRTERTATSNGPSPQWNEQLHLPFHPPAMDFSPSNVEKVRDNIFVSVYDEVWVDLPTSTEGAQARQKEKRFIGRVVVPFPTVHSNGVVEGTFKLEVPVANIGYQREEANQAQEEDGVYRSASKSRQTLLSLYITLKPTLYNPQYVREDPENFKEEDAKVIKYGNSWVKSVLKNERYANRKIMAFATNSNGHLTFLPRYICPQAPPPGLDTVEKLARFVSLIPFLEDKYAFGANADVWSTTEEFLRIRAGDWEEHAILLCNYILYLKTNGLTDSTPYVILGKGIPEGDTAYVLTVEGNGKVFVWNPRTGDAFSHKDPNSTLQSVGVVFNHENLYANVSYHDHPMNLRFDFPNPPAAYWRSFFTWRFSAAANPDQMRSIQATTVRYKEISLSQVQKLESLVERSIWNSLHRWRAAQSTKSARMVSKHLRDVLLQMERVKQYTSGFNESDHRQQLSSVLQAYHMNGFTMNETFTDIETILDTIKSTGVHINAHPQIEFAVAVYVQPYINNIFSVWVYIATVLPKH